MTQEAELIESRLSDYPSIESLLGEIIRRRLRIECSTHGMLTGHLLDEPSSKPDLDRLELVLQSADSCCKDFKLVFQEERLSNQNADAKIIDMLAEVKACEFLCRHGFRDITKIRPIPHAKIVDYTATRNNQNYAVEVTRLGLAQSYGKQPRYTLRVSTIDYGTECEDADGCEFSVITEGINVGRLEKEITDAVNRKYPQIKSFCQTEADMWKRILIVSSGRDYFATGRYENKAYDQTPERDFRQALEQLWSRLRQEPADYRYLDHLVVTRGKDLAKAITYPSL